MTNPQRNVYASGGGDAAGSDDDAAARALLKLVWREGEVYEVRIPKHNRWGQTAGGYFDRPDLLMDAVSRFNGVASVYRTLNPVDPSLLARASNRILAKAEHATSDVNISRRREMLIDFDPVRPSGISSTNDEAARARVVCDEVRKHLDRLGWADPAVVMSGNGWHLIYLLDLPNDEASAGLVAGALRRLNADFATLDVMIDTTVGNASRLTALAGTLKMKGDSTAERPHRMVRVAALPDRLEPVSSAQLSALIRPDEQAAASERRLHPVRKSPASHSVVHRLTEAGIDYSEQPPDAQGITWFHVRQCPFHDDGRPFECGVGQKLPDGPMAGKCFHPEGESKGWAEFRDALGLGRSATRGSRHDHDDRPEIMVSGRYLRDIVDDAWDAVHGANDPVWLFCYGNRLAEVTSEIGEGHTVRVLDAASLRVRVDRIADFVRVDGREDRAMPARPPQDVLESMLVYPDAVPRLRGIVGIPPVTPDGEVDTSEGYQPRSRLFYEANGQPVPPVPVTPTQVDLDRAKALIMEELLGEFPYGDVAGRVNAIAALLTVVARPLYAGPSPLFAFDAPVAGTGKSLLAGVIGAVLTGQLPATLSAPTNDDEWRKRITAKLRSGTSITLIDNVKRPVDSAALCQVLTSPVWSDRLLGTNEDLRLPNRGLWMVTGNNLVLDAEVARRTVWIRLDARRDRPWERQGWRHELPGWALEQRSQLVWALLVLVRHWIGRGKPSWSGTTMGSFEDHNRVVGGILESAGIDGFLENREALYAAVDAESEEWRTFVHAWWERYRDKNVGVKDLVSMVADGDHLPALVPAGKEVSPRSIQTRLGNGLKRRRDRRFGDFFIRALGADSHQGAQRYRLEQAEPADSTDTGSAKVPPPDPVGLDLPAEPAERAEPRWNSDARVCYSSAANPEEPPAARHVPQVRHVQQPDSPTDADPTEPHAEPRFEGQGVQRVAPVLILSARGEVPDGTAVMCPGCGVRPVRFGRLCFRCDPA